MQDGRGLCNLKALYIEKTMRSCERPGYYDIPFEQRRKAAAHLWENEESLRKYMKQLLHVMMGNPESRIVEGETEIAARIRAELYNSGLRGEELIDKLRERLLLEGIL